MAEGRLRVVIARVTPDDRAAAPDWMGADERTRWLALRPVHRRAFVASRRRLRDLLAEATGLPADAWQVSAEAGVAPVASRLDLARDGAPPVSIAHRRDWIAVAVGPVDGGAIGVDIECEGVARADLAARAALVMSRDELARWHALPPDARAPALMRAWVAREAWFKAAGVGAPWDFRHLDGAACAPCEANVRLWEVGDLRVALSARDADALAAASCDGWPGAARVDASSWCVHPLARNSAAPD